MHWCGRSSSIFQLLTGTGSKYLPYQRIHSLVPVLPRGAEYARPTTSAWLPKNRDLSASPSFLLPAQDRKSTRLNSSHVKISYAVFCLKKTNYIGIKFLG